MIDYDLIKQYEKERKKWKKAGKPMRDKEEMERIHSICSECPFFNKDGGFVPGYDQCDICQCNLHPKKKKLNKIAWATTHCPHKPPKWGEENAPEASDGDPDKG